MSKYLNYIVIGCLVVACFSSCVNSGSKGKGTYARTTRIRQENHVDTMTLKNTDFYRQTVCNGKLTAARKSALNFATSGIISAINFHNGQRVKKGDVIALLDTTEAAISLAQARNAMERARIDLNDVLIGFGYGSDVAAVPEDMMSVAKTRSGYYDAEQTYLRALHVYNSTRITAPFSGRVANIQSRVWETTSGAPFCTLIDDSSFDVSFSLLEVEIGSVTPGMPIKVQPFNNTDISYNGQIKAVNPVVNEKGQIMVNAEVENNGDSVLMDGMNVRVVIQDCVRDCQVVPKSAVVMRDEQDVLFVYNPQDSTASWVYVNILMSNSDSHVVVANEERGAQLIPGDVIITSGNLNLAHNSKVTVRQN